VLETLGTDLLDGLAAHVVPTATRCLQRDANSPEALARGRAIPPEARDAMARPLMPVLLYMAAGDAGWLWTAAHERTLTKLWAKPYRARATS
jgi:hypothetical protein